jgi:hypothetical protein
LARRSRLRAEPRHGFSVAASNPRTTIAPAGVHERIEEIIVPESQPISWRSIVYGTPVTASDNERVGKVDEVLGSDAEDIFHGLRVALAHGHRDVMVSSGDVESMSADEVGTSLTKLDVEALPTYDDVATYHLASVGWLRKHIGWRKDAKGDEEPG